jgi:hypothetical protein
VNRIDVKLANGVGDGRNAIDERRATVDDHDRGTVETHEAPGESCRRYFHGFGSHGDAEHPAGADELVE